MIDRLKPYLNDGDLIEEVVAANGKDTYLMPARRNAGHIAIAIIREITAPTVFRNAEEEITDIEDRDGVRRVRATPSKFKFGERAGACWCSAPGTLEGGCRRTAPLSATACRFARRST